MKQAIFEGDLLVVLKPNIWKTVSEITVELETMWYKRRERTKYGEKVVVDASRLYVTLTRFVRQKWAEKRLRDEEPHRIRARGGHQLTEWLLTENGIHTRNQPSARESVHNAEDLVRKPA